MDLHARLRLPRVGAAVSPPFGCEPSTFDALLAARPNALSEQARHAIRRIRDRFSDYDGRLDDDRQRARPAGHIRLPGRADPVPDNQQIERERVLAFEWDCRLGVLQGEFHAQWSVGADAYDDYLPFVYYFVNPC
jgi:hypothetical protein